MSHPSAKHGEDFACYTPAMAQHSAVSSSVQTAGLATSDPLGNDAATPRILSAPTRKTRRARRAAARALRRQRAKVRLLRRRTPTPKPEDAAHMKAAPTDDTTSSIAHAPPPSTGSADDTTSSTAAAPSAPTAHDTAPSTGNADAKTSASTPAPNSDNAVSETSSTPKKRRKAASSHELTHDTELGVISRSIARFASQTLAWLRGPDIVPNPPRMPLFGFIHQDVVQQLQEAPILGLTQLLPYRPQQALTRQDVREHPPLILIHGLAGAPGNFAPIRVWLSMHRPRPIHVFDYREYGDMFPAAEAFGAWLDDLFHQYASHVHFEIMAHSMGGLISRLALLQEHRASRIAHLLTLGTPHQGTTLARLGDSTYLKQLQVDSDVFQRLSAHEPAKLAYDLTSIWTERDILVLPPIHATLPNYPSYAMHQSTHLSWLLHPRLIDQVFGILDARRVAAQDVRIPGSPASSDPS